MPSAEAEQARERVLVVDDDEANRRLLRMVVRRAGWEPLEAADGAEALRAARARRPDAILLDVDMPPPDGFSVCAAVRADPALADTPVLFLTSNDRAEDKLRAFDAGGSDYVTKPFDPREIAARLRTHLQLARLRRTLSEANATLRARQARIEDDLRAAAAIQQALLPRPAAETPGFRVAWRFTPRGDVGGDLVGVQPLGEGATAAWIIDVCGKGVPAAMVAVSIARALAPDAGLVLRGGSPRGPREVLESLAREYPFERFERFFTIVYLLLDGGDGTVRLACAGHPPPLLAAREGAPRPLGRGGIILGLGADLPEEHAATLVPGERILAYTDGASEAESSDGTQLGTEGLAAALHAARDLPLGAALGAVEGAVVRHRGGAPADDDLALLALEYVGPRGGGAR